MTPVFGSLRSLARSVRHMPDRMLHPWRRWRATRLLAQPPRAVLFMCHGNICRSPYAAALARRDLPTSVVIDEAGFIGPGRPSPPEALTVAAEHQIDLSAHRSRVLTPEQLSRADLIIVMDAKQRRKIVRERPAVAGRVVLLGDLDPRPIATRAVPDPYDQPIEVFRSAYDRIDRCVGLLAARWAGNDSRSPR